MRFIEKYKSVLATIIGTICLVIALYAPAMSALLLIEGEIDWKLSNWIFLGLGIIFLWGELIILAKTFQNFISKKTK